MENTTCSVNCPFVKCGFCSSDKECPNYVESWWQQGQTGEPKLVKDCVPKRTMIQLAALQQRFEGVQLAAEQSRNETIALKSVFNSLLNESRRVSLPHENEIKQIDV